jgi:[ribosomal protein S5]-alanine N-acetyltransferase
MNDDIFQTFPTLETSRLVLREITLDDAEDMFRNYSDPQVMRYWGQAPLQSLDEMHHKIAGIAAAFTAREGIRWGIALKGSDRLIGSCGHWRLLKEHLRSEIGYELSIEHWGKGLMPEAIGAIVRFGFERMGLHTIEAQIDPKNQASRRVLEKLGFIQEGYFRENYFFNGEFTDTAVLSLLKAGWLQREIRD